MLCAWLHAGAARSEVTAGEKSESESESEKSDEQTEGEEDENSAKQENRRGCDSLLENDVV